MSDQNKKIQNDDNSNQDDGTGNGNATDNSDKDQHHEKTVPYDRFAQVNAQKKEAVETLEGIVSDLIEDVPEDFRELIPEKLSAADKITWIRKAQKANLFKQQASSGPDSQRPRSKPDIDFNALNPVQKIKMGYKQ